MGRTTDVKVFTRKAVDVITAKTLSIRGRDTYVSFGSSGAHACLRLIAAFELPVVSWIEILLIADIDTAVMDDKQNMDWLTSLGAQDQQSCLLCISSAVCIVLRKSVRIHFDNS